MPTTAGTGRPLSAELGQREREVLHAVGCGLRDDEIAAALASSEDAVAAQLAGILGKLGLRDRAAAIVHAFDCGLVAPGRGPRVRPVRAAPRGTASRTV
ncbi:response regulator transcription factor, partial [Kitasatospora sp. MY 5-36]|uniref:response regulator transcription factor n=1 Tax=Kitasatospora sp. MY 5-36 TaxID=1678027 RepID=UPI0006716243